MTAKLRLFNANICSIWFVISSWSYTILFCWNLCAASYYYFISSDPYYVLQCNALVSRFFMSLCELLRQPLIKENVKRDCCKSAGKYVYTYITVKVYHGSFHLDFLIFLNKYILQLCRRFPIPYRCYKNIMSNVTSKKNYIFLTINEFYPTQLNSLFLCKQKFHNLYSALLQTKCGKLENQK